MTTATIETMMEQRRTVRTQRNGEVSAVKTLITKLVPQGSYADYLDISERLNELELYWDLIQIQLRHVPFNFRTRIEALRADATFIHGDYLAGELNKADPQDIHGFFRRIEELGNDLRTKKNVYTQFPEIRESLNKIARLSADECALKIQANSSYGNQTHAFSKQLFRTQ